MGSKFVSSSHSPFQIRWLQNKNSQSLSDCEEGPACGGMTMPYVLTMQPFSSLTCKRQQSKETLSTYACLEPKEQIHLSVLITREFCHDVSRFQALRCKIKDQTVWVSSFTKPFIHMLHTHSCSMRRSRRPTPNQHSEIRSNSVPSQRSGLSHWGI
jgi:hypothetical protein